MVDWALKTNDQTGWSYCLVLVVKRKPSDQTGWSECLVLFVKRKPNDQTVVDRTV